MALEKIKKANDIKNLTPEELVSLPDEIRSFLIDTISVCGGHLASNLGVVELTMALHLVLDLPKDKLIFDVGHQSYTHKILTGRKDDFSTLRSYEGLSGFPKRDESPCDAFGTGHSSTSISAGLGMAFARDLKGENYTVISVIGDGSLTGGMVYEALNNAAALKSNFIIVLNDNKMSISENVGGMSEHLSRLRTSTGYTGFKARLQNALERIPWIGKRIVSGLQKIKSSVKQILIPGMLFENLGVMYLGPVNGHNVTDMVTVLNQAKQYKGPVLVHVLTQKGRGFDPAVRHPSRFHGADPFDKEKGLPLKSTNPGYTDIFSTVMRKMGDRDEKVVAITAAMMDGTGLKRFHNMFPERFFDVGIAEEHAVTFAAALAAQGLKPVFAVYSSFLQRAYDQIVHDVCCQNLHVIFAVDRAGLVGKDGVTHQGVFDLSYLSSMPNMTVMAPKNKYELSDMLKFAIDFDGPIALRYPRGEAVCDYEEYRDDIVLGRGEVLLERGDILLYAIGSMVDTAMKAAAVLAEEGIEVSVTNARFAKPLDREYLKKAAKRYKAIITLEENALSGGFGEHVLKELNSLKYKGTVKLVGIPDEFIQHGAPDVLKHVLKIDAEGVVSKVKKVNKKIKGHKGSDE
ncbi:MAG: 1-deoxy-D-xylulose-5-phosphate synthase [Lachnospiraceae bacterium]|nr:1-deoxy-D-xylulose-5-phosphate synthase [Lachnospiraceae bacterium]